MPVRHKLGRPAWRVIAFIVAVTFFFAATSVDLYKVTSPRDMTRELFGPDVIAFAHPWWLSLHIWLRKGYSIVAFALVGFTLDRALGPTPRPAVRAATLVAVYSLAIEIVQRLYVAPETNAESALDIACGGLGGWLGVAAGEAFDEAQRRRRSARLTDSS